MLVVEGLVKRFGGFTAVNKVSFRVEQGEILGLIGPNGSGKSTIFNMLSGTFAPSAGSMKFEDAELSGLAPHRIINRGIGRTFQIPRPFKSMTVVENLMVALDFAVVGHGLGEGERRDEVMSLLERMGLAAKAFRPSSELSQVELRKMELARAMAARPKLLVSDEAMAGLSSSEIDEVLDLLFKLNGEGITIIMIEHIMHAVMRFSERVMCLDAGRIIASGRPAEVMADKRVQEAYLGAQA